MSTENSLLRQIDDAPADLGVRGVLADYFEERGDVRAGLVRLEAAAIKVAGVVAPCLRAEEYVVPPRFDSLRTHHARLVARIDDLVRRVDEQAGDGRKTAALLAAKIMERTAAVIYRGRLRPSVAVKLPEWGAQATDIVRSMSRPARTAEDVLAVLHAATHGHFATADCLLNALRDAGADGVIQVHARPEEPPSSPRFSLEDGRRFPLRHVPEWVHGQMRYVCPIVCCGELPEPRAVVPLLHHLRDVGRAAVLLYPSPQPIEWIEQQLSRESRFVPIRYTDDPRDQEIVSDIAELTGGRLLTNHDLLETGLENTGGAEVQFDPGTLVIRRYEGQPSEGYAIRLYEMIDAEPDPAIKEWHQRRAARLFGQIAHVEVAAGLDTDRMMELTCTAMHAARGFVEYGGVPAGGAAYLHCSEQLRRLPQHLGNAGIECLSAALRAPLTTLAENAGREVDLAHLASTPTASFDTRRRQFATDEPDPLGDRPTLMDAAKVVSAVIQESCQTAADALREAAA